MWPSNTVLDSHSGHQGKENLEVETRVKICIASCGQADIELAAVPPNAKRLAVVMLPTQLIYRDSYSMVHTKPRVDIRIEKYHLRKTCEQFRLQRNVLSVIPRLHDEAGSTSARRALDERSSSQLVEPASSCKRGIRKKVVPQCLLGL